jgi:hypothetical protein
MLQSNASLDVEVALQIANALVVRQTAQHLNTLQTQIFRAAWLEQTYEEMVATCHCSEAHIKRVGATLWQLLSQVLSEEVTKKTIHAAIARYYQTHQARLLTTHASEPAITPALAQAFTNEQLSDLPYPEGQIELRSPFYVERPPLEEKCYQEILRPGSLIRIKAPHQMGKTSLLMRLLHHAQTQGFHTVALNLQLVDSKTFQDLDGFLQWFCAIVTHKLQLPLKLETYWSDIFGSKTSCKDYFEYYLLPQLTQPLVIAFDEVDTIFQYTEISEQFFALLRAWHEEAKTSEIWQNLRLVLVHSTEIYTPLNINHSPFNVGLPIELPEFDSEQVETLVKIHQLNWTMSQVQQLLTFTGGHPYLVRMALYHIACDQLPVSQWMSLAATEIEPFSNHLRKHLLILEQQPQLITALKSLVMPLESARLRSADLFKLSRMGLLRLQNNQAAFSCDLYRQYFTNCL